VPDSFVLSDTTMAEAQERMPNRHGFTTDHGLWPGKPLGKPAMAPPDVQAPACMRNCAADPKVASFLPDHARNNHGNLANQQRLVGPQRGADTTLPAGAGRVAAPVPRAQARSPGAAAQALAQKNNCTVCHGVDSRIVGPGFREIAGRYAARTDAETYLAGKIRSGSQGVWGAIPMPAQTLTDGDARLIAQWLASGARP
jgi:cytochrome c551/c552